MDIIRQINDVASSITENDIDEWIVPRLLEHYSTKINYLANKTYGNSLVRDDDGPNVGQLAFKENARTALRKGVETFILKQEYWKSGRDINTYLITILNRLSNQIVYGSYGSSGLPGLTNAKKVNVPVCPACKFLQKKEFLTPFGEQWKCPECSNELNRLESEIKSLKENDNLGMLAILEARSTLFKTFAIHSKAGYRCPDCSRFIPESSNGQYGIACPYPDCMFFGSMDSLEKMIHPLSLTLRNNISLQSTPLDNEGKGASLQDLFAADTVDPDIHIEINESFKNDLNLLTEVIEQQLSTVKRTNYSGTMLQKVLMYEAYSNMLKKYPEDMVSYLVHRKQKTDFPIQSKIFQEYARLMQCALPCTIVRGQKEYDIVSLMDPNLSLFEGISVFDAVVKNDLSIPNNTVETYTGGRKFKEYGPCFIGMLIDVTDNNTGKSIRSDVVDYSFVQVKFNENVLPGTPVTVKHYRIQSHYEVGSMVFLQRSRKKIVNSIYFRMHKKKREPGE